jgi:hypothetical protein
MTYKVRTMAKTKRPDEEWWEILSMMMQRQETIPYGLYGAMTPSYHLPGEHSMYVPGGMVPMPRLPQYPNSLEQVVEANRNNGANPADNTGGMTMVNPTFIVQYHIGESDVRKAYETQGRDAYNAKESYNGRTGGAPPVTGSNRAPLTAYGKSMSNLLYGRQPSLGLKAPTYIPLYGKTASGYASKGGAAGKGK